MGAHIGWEPVVKPPIGGELSTAMKHALAERYTGGDTAAAKGIELGKVDLPWLEGVAVGAAEGDDLHDDAATLIAAIREYGSVRTIPT